MTPEQATELLEILRFHLSWTALWWGFGVGFTLGAGLMLYKFVRSLFDQTD